MGRFFPGRFALARKRAHLPNPLIKTVEILSGTVEASLRDDKSYFKFDTNHNLQTNVSLTHVLSRHASSRFNTNQRLSPDFVFTPQALLTSRIHFSGLCRFAVFEDGPDTGSLSSNQVSAPGIRAPLCGSHLSLVVLITGTLTLSSSQVPTRRMMMSRTYGLTAWDEDFYFFKITTDLPLSVRLHTPWRAVRMALL